MDKVIVLSPALSLFWTVGCFGLGWLLGWLAMRGR